MSKVFQILEFVLSVITYFIIKLQSFLETRDIVPTLYCRESALTKHLIKRRGILNRAFHPPRLLGNSFVQTLLGYFIKPPEDLEFDREYIQMEYNGSVAIDWYVPSKCKFRRTSPVILIFPRLTGDAVSVGQLCKLAAMKNIRTVVFNRRGHGASLLTSPKLTSTGDTNDSKQVLEYILYKFPGVCIVGVGIGAGCATVFSYLGEYGSSSRLKAAVCISPSYDNTTKLCEQIPKFYELLLLINMKRMIMRYSKALYKLIDINAVIFKSWSLKEFDYHVYCKMYGIETFEAFWKRNDPMRDVDDIAMPVLCINSMDDPVSTRDNIPFELFRFYPNLLLITVDKGGHCAFLENIWDASWADALALNYVQGVLEFIANSRVWF